MTRWTPKVGEIVAVRDRHRDKWCAAEVTAVNLLQRLFCAKAGDVWFSGEVIHPKNIRQVRLVYCQRCSEMRARRAA